MTAMDMLKARQSATRTSPVETREGAEKDDIAIVPLALPLLAGPGAIATVMVSIGRAKGAIATAGVLAAIVVTMFASYLILRTAEYTERWISTTVKAILVRVMGLLLAAIAVQFAIEGTIEALVELDVLDAGR
jgi:multiple antibiotic resistance protein